MGRHGSWSARLTGMDWDFRKKRPYSGYEQFDFDIPIAHRATVTIGSVVRVEEMRQSLRIIEQCVKNMPAGTIQGGPSPCNAAAEGTDDARY